MLASRICDFNLRREGQDWTEWERMLIAVAIDAEGGDQHQVVANMQAITLHNQQVDFG